MRLIDADRLQGILECEQEHIKDIPTRIDGLIDAIMNVLSAPTVDAVPVSWIMAQVAERKERGTAFDLNVASTLRTMVKEWKEERDGNG